MSLTSRTSLPVEHSRPLSCEVIFRLAGQRQGTDHGWRTGTRDRALSKQACSRPIVSGHVGVKEIEILIRTLQIDKKILADEGEETADE
jgi:hypothetical protein